LNAVQVGGIGPNVEEAEASSRSQGAKLWNGIFVCVFSSDQLTLGEEDGRTRDTGLLVGETADVDFDPPFDLVIEGEVLEPV
jgi:hypothetical protein